MVPLKVLLTRESRRLVSRRYAHKIRKGWKIVAVSGSSCSRLKFLVIMFLTSVLAGWYVNTSGMVFCSTAASTCSGIRSSRGMTDTEEEGVPSKRLVFFFSYIQ